jgi:lysophospholipase L1-like esterase
MLGADGKPRPELLVEDGLHMTPAGYDIWTRLVMEHLDALGVE